MRVLVTGGSGMVGQGFLNLDDENTDIELYLVGSADGDLRDISAVDTLIERHKPDAIIHLAARVGGVKGNTDFVADFFEDNIAMNTNVLQSAANHRIRKVISLLSTCVYPDKVNYPLTEDQIHNGPPHPSNFGYAYAKRMLDVHSRALRQQYGCNFICAVPNNLYGPHDNFDLENGHVIPAIIRKVWEAKISSISPVFWSDGSALREFTYAPDLAGILLYLLDEYNDPDPINIGIIEERSIKSVVKSICENLGYNGDVIWDETKPGGQHRKPSSNKKLIDLGWKKNDYTSFDIGLKRTCDWFIKNYPNVRGVE